MKRVLDISISSILLIVLGPLFLLLMAVIWVSMGRPVFFTQTRTGLGGEPFSLFKFRTMSDAVDEHGQALPDHDRLTRIGRFLRRTSLDELPELWNVVKGDMSLVGPRPLLPQYLPRYTPAQARRHEVRPGITGWAQVNGRNTIGWEEKFAYDVWYVDNNDLGLDFRILVMTIAQLFRVSEVNQPGHATAEEFKGGDD